MLISLMDQQKKGEIILGLLKRKQKNQRKLDLLTPKTNMEVVKILLEKHGLRVSKQLVGYYEKRLAEDRIWLASNRW